MGREMSRDPASAHHARNEEAFVEAPYEAPHDTEVRKTLRPGMRGTRKLGKEFGDRLVCVRYRYDRKRGLRWTTVELVASAPRPWTPKPLPSAGALVYVRTGPKDWDLRRRLASSGGVSRDGVLDLWRMRYETAIRLGLKRRIVAPPRPLAAPSGGNKIAPRSIHLRENPPGKS
jgi:hypothetical protein